MGHLIAGLLAGLFPMVVFGFLKKILRLSIG
jgi:hypothetical protein